MASIEADNGSSFIEALHVAGYGCVIDATFRLTRLHAFVGPNDSGKSTLLRAIETLLIAGAATQGEGLQRLAGGDGRWPADGSAQLSFRLCGHGLQYQLERQDAVMMERLVYPNSDGGRDVLESRLVHGNQPGLPCYLRSRTVARALSNVATTNTLGERTMIPPGAAFSFDSVVDSKLLPDSATKLQAFDTEAHALSDWIGAPVLLRLDPDALRQPRSLIPRTAPFVLRMNEAPGSQVCLMPFGTGTRRRIPPCATVS